MRIRIEVEPSEDGEEFSSLDIVSTIDGVPALYRGLATGKPTTITCPPCSQWMPGAGVLIAPAGVIQLDPAIAAAANEQQA